MEHSTDNDNGGDDDDGDDDDDDDDDYNNNNNNVVIATAAGHHQLAYFSNIIRPYYCRPTHVTLSFSDSVPYGAGHSPWTCIPQLFFY